MEVNEEDDTIDKPTRTAGPEDIRALVRDTALKRSVQDSNLFTRDSQPAASRLKTYTAGPEDIRALVRDNRRAGLPRRARQVLFSSSLLSLQVLEGP